MTDTMTSQNVDLSSWDTLCNNSQLEKEVQIKKCVCIYKIISGRSTLGERFLIQLFIIFVQQINTMHYFSLHFVTTPLHISGQF
jgi:hypothetical protein